MKRREPDRALTAQKRNKSNGLSRNGLGWVAMMMMSSCGSLSLLRGPAEEVVYALGSLEGFPSPLNRKLTPACPALVFVGEGFQLSGRQQLTLDGLAEQWKERPERFLLAGYCAPDRAADHARALSERRAQAVRQRLIELGVEPAQLQTVGYGNDFTPSAPSGNVVVIYLVDREVSEELVLTDDPPVCH